MPLSSGFLGRVLRKIQSVQDQRADLRNLHRATRHVSGPTEVTLGATDVALVCLMKNAAYTLPELLHHHRSIGIRHFLFIDNGSTDSSVQMLRDQPDITVVENLLPVARYESLLRSELARKVLKGGWFLFVDTDELAEFPGAAGCKASDIAAYCNAHHYDAVVSQMLDLFSTASLRETGTWSFATTIARFNQYSLRAVKALPYHSPDIAFSYYLESNTPSNPEITFNFGGIRNEVFGENCALTKHSLVRNSPDLQIYSHPHCSSRVRCADFSMLLRHYKFAGDFLDRERQQVLNKTWTHGEDANRLARIDSPDFAIQSASAKTLSHIDQLVDEGFLILSDQFRAAFGPGANLAETSATQS